MKIFVTPEGKSFSNKHSSIFSRYSTWGLCGNLKKMAKAFLRDLQLFMSDFPFAWSKWKSRCFVQAQKCIIEQCFLPPTHAVILHVPFFFFFLSWIQSSTLDDTLYRPLKVWTFSLFPLTPCHVLFLPVLQFISPGVPPDTWVPQLCPQGVAARTFWNVPEVAGTGVWGVAPPSPHRAPQALSQHQGTWDGPQIFPQPHCAPCPLHARRVWEQLQLAQPRVVTPSRCFAVWTKRRWRPQAAELRLAVAMLCSTQVRISQLWGASWGAKKPFCVMRYTGRGCWRTVLQVGRVGVVGRMAPGPGRDGALSAVLGGCEGKHLLLSPHLLLKEECQPWWVEAGGAASRSTILR